MRLSVIVSLLFLIILFASCNRHITGQQNNKDLLVFPSIPDSAKIQYLTKFTGSEDILKPRSKFTEFVLGKRSSINIGKPYGIFLKNKKIYITDTSIPGLDIIDLEKRNFYQFMPQGRGRLSTPVNCYVDDLNNLYVSDSKRNQIVVYDEKGNYKFAVGDTGKFRPTDVVVYKDRIYIPNIKNHKIHVFANDSTNTLISSFPDSEPGNSDYLYSPSNIYIKNDMIYVSDFGDFCVKKYSMDGEFIRKFGEQGLGYGQFNRNKGIAVDNEENLFVVDASFNNVQIFDNQGRVLMAFGGAYTGTSGFLYLPAKITIDYDHLEYFQQFVDSRYDLKYLLFVTNQYGPDRVTVYGRVEVKK